ncbi:MAG: tRNA (N(6)-L-threonylcarbamoyladenosine(37)-C(2))-methylthiotransferase [Methanobacteriaceae archaeon]|nr:tRNA (N(6)-L-threonylcarbamoyladenosine(37)-C(2))-methylthiotransferase [Methanobacteriaceae archaeon]
MNIYIETHGCTFNQADSEILSGLLVDKKHKIVDNIEESDIIILNTCYVKQPTEQKMITKIRKFQKEYSDKKLIIAGCMVEIDRKMLKKVAPNSSWIGPHQLNSIVNIVENLEHDKIIQDIKRTDDIKVCQPKIRSNPLIHIIQICEGCTGNCTFCCTRLARGKLYSYPSNLIIKEAQNAINSGCKEIDITAQDTACYGKENNQSFSNLLNELGQLDGKYRVRIGMMHPKNIIPIQDQVIDAFKNHENLYNFVHLPIQTGSDKVLKEMNRQHSIDDYKKLISNFRKNIPEISIATDIIVGYPTETEEDFQETLKLLEEVKFDIIHVSKYMHRPGAISSDLKSVSYEVMKDRTHRLNEVKNKVMFDCNEKYLNTKQKILIIDKGKKGGYVGYNNSYKNVIVDNATIGSFINVEIVDYKSTYLLSKKIN